MRSPVHTMRRKPSVSALSVCEAFGAVQDFANQRTVSAAI